MLRSAIPNLSIWVYIFGFGLGDEILSIDSVSDVDFPACIRIKGDISDQDIDTHGIIDQKFVFNKRNDKPDKPRYVSSDGKYSFKFNNEYDNDFQWFLIPRGANLVNAYLKTPAPYIGAILSKNPFIIADCAWKIYTDQIWQSVTNRINVESCEESKQQVQQTKECLESNSKPQISNQVPQGSNQVQQGYIEPEVNLDDTEILEPPIENQTISPSTIAQSNAPASTVQMIIESIPECIQIKTDLKFLEDNNDEKIKIESILKVLLELNKIFQSFFTCIFSWIKPNL